MTTSTCRSHYLNVVFDPNHFQHLFKESLRVLSEIKFDAFLCTGNSGTLMVGGLAAMLNKGIILVRKENEDSHYYNNHSSTQHPCIEGMIFSKRVVIIDDMICSGKTFNRLVTTYNKFLNDKGSDFPEVAAIFLYNQERNVHDYYHDIDPYFRGKLTNVKFISMCLNISNNKISVNTVDKY